MTQTVTDGIEDILRQKREGTYAESDAAVLITRDEGTGILTFSFHGVDNDEGWNVFWDAVKTARVHGTHPELSMNEIRVERRVGVTDKVSARASQNLYVLSHSETWPDLLDILERCCIEIETDLINVDPSEKMKVLEYHKLSKAAWMIFESMQEKIIAAGNAYFSGVEPQPAGPQMTAEERERENILNPTRFLAEENRTATGALNNEMEMDQ